MGASSWSYFTPYQSDIEQDLKDLRQEVFRRGEYYNPAEFHRTLYERNIGQQMPPPNRQAYRAEIERMEDQPHPTTIAELLSANRIEQIAPEPDFGVAAPLTPQELVKLFGTNQPTHAMVAHKADDICSLRQRWQGTYIVVYQDNTPSELYFAGYSGD